MTSCYCELRGCGAAELTGIVPHVGCGNDLRRPAGEPVADRYARQASFDDRFPAAVASTPQLRGESRTEEGFYRGA